MNGKINKNGNLEIQRAGEFKSQVCPYRVHIQFDYACGDWCPLFGEPINVNKPEENEEWRLNLCQRHIYFESFTDERGKE